MLKRAAFTSFRSAEEWHGDGLEDVLVMPLIWEMTYGNDLYFRSQGK